MTAQVGAVYTDVNELNATNGFSFYPNPVKDYLFLNLKKNPFERFEIYDMTGQKVAAFTGNSKALFMGTLTSGVYMLRAFDKEQNLFQQKFLKE